MNTARADPWRLRCPNEHASWTYRPKEGKYHCTQCDSFFSHLLDMVTGNLVAPGSGAR